ncbi:MAG: RHS repeat-associated core domain-containing protein [Myxococcota bacterium]
MAVSTQRSGSNNRAYIAGTDHLGAPLRLFNTTSGEIDWLADAEPFGAYWTHVPSSASDTSLEFNVRGSNQYFDAETGLHANWYRYYDPNTGRYITEDPLLREIPGFEQPSAAFAMNNPGVYTDPDGRYSLPLPPPPPGPIVITPGGAIVYGGIVISAIVCAMIPACARFVFGIGPADEPNSCEENRPPRRRPGDDDPENEYCFLDYEGVLYCEYTCQSTGYYRVEKPHDVECLDVIVRKVPKRL